MEYRIVYPDELYHYGVKGMKWGIRKQLPVTIGKRIGGTKSGVSSEERKVARRRTAKKYVKIGLAVVGAAAVTYGAYRVGKLRQSALTELGKKSIRVSKDYLSMYQMRRDTASRMVNEADRIKIRLGEYPNHPGNKYSRQAMNNLMSGAEEKRRQADEAFNESVRYHLKAKDNNFSRKEILNEMGLQLQDEIRRRKLK